MTSWPQTRMTFHPLWRNATKFRQSLARFVSILSRQKGFKPSFHFRKRYPCQKSPSIKTAIFARVKTKSGVPGSPLTCLRKRRPRRCNAERSVISIGVSFCRTRDIARERCSGVSESATLYRILYTVYKFLNLADFLVRLQILAVAISRLLYEIIVCDKSRPDCI